MSSSTLKLGKFVKFREEKFGGVLFETRQERVFSLNPTAGPCQEDLSPTGTPLRFPDRFVNRLPQPTSPDDARRPSPRLRHSLLFLALGCVLVRPLEEADDGPAAPHAEEVHRDEKQGQGCGDPLFEKRNRLVFVVLEEKNDDHRHDDQEEDQVNPPHGTPPARETGVKKGRPGRGPLSRTRLSRYTPACSIRQRSHVGCTLRWRVSFLHGAGCYNNRIDVRGFLRGRDRLLDHPAPLARNQVAVKE